MRYLRVDLQFVVVHSATPAAAQPLEDPPYAGKSSVLHRSASSPATVRSGVTGRGTAEGSGRESNTVSELDKVEFSAWTGINAAEFGQV